MKRNALIVALPLAAIAVLIGAISLVYVAAGGSGAGSTSSVQAADPAHPPTAPNDRVVVLSRTMPPPSTGTRLNAKLVSGSVPATGIEATVLDDLDCTPDANGISHCRNPLRLADGRQAEIVHPHSMAVVPCLAAGEQVRLVWQ